MAVEKQTTASHDEKLIAIAAHISIALSLIGQGTIIIPPVSVIIPLGIWIVENIKPKPSKFIQYQAKQAFFFQMAIYLIMLAITIAFAILSIIGIGKLRYIFYFIIGIPAICYGCYGAWQIWKDKPFRYLFVADFIEAGEKKK